MVVFLCSQLLLPPHLSRSCLGYNEQTTRGGDEHEGRLVEWGRIFIYYFIESHWLLGCCCETLIIVQFYLFRANSDRFPVLLPCCEESKRPCVKSSARNDHENRSCSVLINSSFFSSQQLCVKKKTIYHLFSPSSLLLFWAPRCHPSHSTRHETTAKRIRYCRLNINLFLLVVDDVVQCSAKRWDSQRRCGKRKKLTLYHLQTN